MAKKPTPVQIRIEEFTNYVRKSVDSSLLQMMDICDMQFNHPDHVNRCWSGSRHQVPFVEVRTILLTEIKRRELR